MDEIAARFKAAFTPKHTKASETVNDPSAELMRGVIGQMASQLAPVPHSPHSMQGIAAQNGEVTPSNPMLDSFLKLRNEFLPMQNRPHKTPI